MRLPKRLVLLPLIAASLLIAGCGPSTRPTPALAPVKPLSQAEEGLLKEIEALPKDKRQEFVMRHMGEIAQYSAGNRTFGQRMDAASKSASK